MADITPIFDAILEHVPAPQGSSDLPLQMLITSISGDNFKPYIAKFKIEKTHKNYGLGVKLLEVVKR